ncbi:MAG: hypothetical protein Q8L27_03830 [archaeon]|nr:hypothetical protein [archaeon]
MYKSMNSCDALRIMDDLRKKPRTFRKYEDKKRKELITKAYSTPEIKARFDLYDENQDREDWGGAIRLGQICSVCGEKYDARGRQTSLQICSNCIQLHEKIRDAEIIEQENELEILLRVHGCKQSR